MLGCDVGVRTECDGLLCKGKADPRLLFERDFSAKNLPLVLFRFHILNKGGSVAAMNI